MQKLLLDINISFVYNDDHNLLCFWEDACKKNENRQIANATEKRERDASKLISASGAQTTLRFGKKQDEF